MLGPGCIRYGDKGSGWVADAYFGSDAVHGDARRGDGIKFRMERHAAELLRDALTLPPETRASLVDSLIDSLDQTVEEGAEEAWRQEIELRLQQIFSWRSARQRLGDRLNG